MTALDPFDQLQTLRTSFEEQFFGESEEVLIKFIQLARPIVPMLGAVGTVLLVTLGAQEKACS